MKLWAMKEVYDYVSQNYPCNFKKPDFEKEQYQVEGWLVQFDFRNNEYIAHHEPTNLGYKESQGEISEDPLIIQARQHFLALLEKSKLENELPSKESPSKIGKAKV